MEKNQEIEKYFNFVENLLIEVGKVFKVAIDSEKIIELKGNYGDLVTQTDKEIEHLLISRLHSEFPYHKFIAEECAYEAGNIHELTDEPTWIIDPIDGTFNFVHGFPQCCISIALTINKIVEVGLIYNPSNGEFYTAKKGQGAFLNGKKIKTSTVTELSQSIVIIDPTAFRINFKYRDIVKARMDALIDVAGGIRNVGSAALAMAYVARGIIDVFHMDGLKPWDIAAGYLLVEEAGGITIDSKGGTYDIMKPRTIAASNESLAKEVSKLIVETDLQTQRKRLKRT